MPWEVEYTGEFARLFTDTLSEDDQELIAAAVNELERDGPALGRPFVENIHTSRHANIKELRPTSSTIRIFFAFDPRRMAILLIGGDKRGDWSGFHDLMIRVADDLCDEHPGVLRREKLIP